MQDPVFYQYFVKLAPGYCTENLCKAKRIANGTKIQYHSLSLTDNQNAILKLKLLDAKPGDVIDLEEPPLSVNVVLNDEEKNDNTIKQWRDLTLIPNRVIIPICDYKPKGGRDSNSTPIPGYITYKPSRVRITRMFPLDPGFAMTVEKAQGQTLERVILALSFRQGMSCNLDYESIYVSFSRVQKNEHIRTLLSGRTMNHRMCSLEYIPNLRPHKSISAFFNGYLNDRCSEWKINQWDEDKAYSIYSNR
jgi:hypothetical protein